MRDMVLKPLNAIIPAVMGGVAGGLQLGWLYSLVLGAVVGAIWFLADLHFSKRAKGG
jgi:predicted lipid-binding transport protein (Tim44 family)